MILALTKLNLSLLTIDYLRNKDHSYFHTTKEKEHCQCGHDKKWTCHQGSPSANILH